MTTYLLLLVLLIVLVIAAGLFLRRRQAEARQAVDEASEEVKQRVAPLMQPCLRFVPDSRSRSYLGGMPPEGDFAWPRRWERPLAFLACIDLGELSSRLSFSWLPDTGRLLFFYDVEEQPWGFEPEDSAGWRVIYQEGPEEAPRQAPRDLKQNWIARRKPVAFQRLEVPPPSDHPALRPLEFSDVEYDALEEYRSRIYGDGPSHQVGGYPEPIQNSEMAIECQLVSNGLSCGDGSVYEDPRAKKLEPGAADWRLLLQLDSDDDMDWMWGDGGMIYFWIRHQDARNQDFHKTWLQLQCF